jgi:demethylmenaquinone methyltransferase/2-methoxy-6-polyprenyl-1,4-benzoquinol methylase
MQETHTSFGFRSVRTEEKASLVRDVFSNVASRYDVMNDAMSLGFHRLWKNQFIHHVRANASSRFLDVAGGTGDIAARLHRQYHAPILVCDINEAMLREGRNRMVDRGQQDAFTWICGNAESLPFPERSRDIYTIAFGIRNVTDIPDALREAHRVLDFGGQFLCLEFSPAVTPALQPLYDAYSFRLIPQLGEWIANDRASYQYLAESIRTFPRPENFARMIGDAGFSRIRTTPLSGGICYIHEGWKL